MNKCNVIKDLLPLYADEVCSEDSREMVEEHISSCKDCMQELEDYRYNTGLPEVSADVAMKKFKKKMSIKILKVAASIVACMAILLVAAYFMFVPEYVVDYHDGLLDAKIPVDEGVDVWVNLDNYSYVQAFEIEDEDENLNVYLTVIQNNYTRFFGDSDDADHLFRITKDNTRAVCYQSSNVYPISGKEPKVKNIYYLEMNPEDILYMTDGISFSGYETHLIWSAPESE